MKKKNRDEWILIMNASCKYVGISSLNANSLNIYVVRHYLPQFQTSKPLSFQLCQMHEKNMLYIHTYILILTRLY